MKSSHGNIMKKSNTFKDQIALTSTYTLTPMVHRLCLMTWQVTWTSSHRDSKSKGFIRGNAGIHSNGYPWIDTSSMSHWWAHPSLIQSQILKNCEANERKEKSVSQEFHFSNITILILLCFHVYIWSTNFMAYLHY